MKLARLSASLVLAALALSPALAAQQVIVTKAGQSFSGSLISDDGKSIKFNTNDGLQMTLPYGDLSPATLYRLMAPKVARDDGPGQLKLGDQAAAADLFNDARQAYSRAVAADTALADQVAAKLATLRAAASQSLLADAKSAAEHGRPDVAQHDLALLMHEFPGEAATQEGSAMLQSLQASQAAARSKSRSAALSQEIQQALALVEKTYAEMGTKITKGLQATGNETDAIDDFKSVVAMGTQARLDLKEVATQQASLQGMAAAAKSLDDELVSRMVDGYTQMANAYNQRTSYNDANTAVNQGLALEPNNQNLLQLRQQIASNSAEGGAVVGWEPTRWRGR